MQRASIMRAFPCTAVLIQGCMILCSQQCGGPRVLCVRRFFMRASRKFESQLLKDAQNWSSPCRKMRRCCIWMRLNQERGVGANLSGGFFALLMEKRVMTKLYLWERAGLFFSILIGEDWTPALSSLHPAIKFNDIFDCILHKRQLAFKSYDDVCWLFAPLMLNLMRILLNFGAK